MDNLWKDLKPDTPDRKKLFKLYLQFSGLSDKEIEDGPDNLSEQRLKECGLKRT